MSIRKLPRELGIVISCNGVESRSNCAAKLQTGQIQARGVRAYAKTLKWGRGLRKGRKRCDQCSECMPIERRLFEEEKKRILAWRIERDERRKAVWVEKQEAKKAEAAANPKPKKPRSKKRSAQPSESPPPAPSHSEASAPAASA